MPCRSANSPKSTKIIAEERLDRRPRDEAVVPNGEYADGADQRQNGVVDRVALGIVNHDPRGFQPVVRVHQTP